ncbi:MAG: hypothetical protein ABI772_07510 [Bacteroidota bacterium]
MKNDIDKEWEDELENAPFLASVAGNDPFKAPDGYFDTFSSTLIDRINAEKEKTWSYKLNLLFRKPMILIPALAVVVFAIIWFNRSGSEASNTQQYISMNYDDIYNSGLVSDLDESTMSDYIDADSQKSTTKEEDAILESVSEETLISEL